MSGDRGKLSFMSAEPAGAEDPDDPAVILRDLPQQERGEFLRQYHEAIDAAHDPAGYRRLQRLLHVWRLTVIAASRPGYYEDLAAVRDGSARGLHRAMRPAADGVNPQPWT
jgi:Family of unknown function (DUF6247)